MIIEVKNLFKTFGTGDTQVNALRGVSLSLEKGEFLSLVGPSGCGKSTLLHILGAMDTPTKGEIILNGQNLGKMKAKALTELRLKSIGFIFQTFNLIPTINALQNVMIPMTLAGNTGKAAKEKAVTLLEQVGLKERMKHLPSQMSGGQRQRVAIARALANDPAIILADEPTGNLDSENGDIIVGLLMSLNKKGHTIVMVTHNNELALKAGKTVSIKDGKIM